MIGYKILMIKRALTTILALMIFFEIFLAVLLVSPTFVDRRAHAQAVAQYHDNPTQENLEVLNREILKTKKIKMKTNLIIVSIFVLNSIGILSVLKKGCGCNERDKIFFSHKAGRYKI